MKYICISLTIFFSSLLPITEGTLKPVHATGFQWRYPIYRDYVSICLLQYDQSYRSDEFYLKMWNEIVCRINEKDENILFYVPGREELHFVFEKGFKRFEKKDNVSTMFPRFEFWQKTDFHYIVLGNKKVENEKTWLEMRIYSIWDGKRLIGKRYTGYENDLENLFSTITESLSDQIKAVKINEISAK